MLTHKKKTKSKKGIDSLFSNRSKFYLNKKPRKKISQPKEKCVDKKESLLKAQMESKKSVKAQKLTFADTPNLVLTINEKQSKKISQPKEKCVVKKESPLKAVTQMESKKSAIPQKVTLADTPDLVLTKNEKLNKKISQPKEKCGDKKELLLKAQMVTKKTTESKKIPLADISNFVLKKNEKPNEKILQQKEKLQVKKEAPPKATVLKKTVKAQKMSFADTSNLFLTKEDYVFSPANNRKKTLRSAKNRKTSNERRIKITATVWEIKEANLSVKSKQKEENKSTIELRKSTRKRKNNQLPYYLYPYWAKKCRNNVEKNNEND